MTLQRWPHQIKAVAETLAAIEGGQRRIVLTSPTGGGKSLIMTDLIETWASAGLRVALYSNRKMLTEQTARVLDKAGIDYAVRASGWTGDDFQPVQLCSIQTEDARVLRGKKHELHRADRVLIDEVHQCTGHVAQNIMQTHLETGAAIVGVTATPLGLGGLFERLVVAGTTSELRACGALVPCRIYGPDEPDLKEREKSGDVTEKQARSWIMRDGIFGRVLHWFDKLNPTRRPSILFAPGVKESLWFAEQFHQAGITAAHIDGDDVWINGTFQKAGARSRAAVLKGSKDGSICIVCNRFVLREGIDAPWLSHGVLATVFGSLQSYLQSVGRLLRASPGLDAVTLQDHGGNYWRHGSPNADRHWSLAHTASIAAGLREEELRADREKQPTRCPKCAMILLPRNGWIKCPCGWQAASGKRSRMVVQSDGQLKEMANDIYRPRRVCAKPDGPALWRQMYFRARSKKWNATFRQAFALFAEENHWGYPDKKWPLMPISLIDEFRRVADVPPERLRS